MSSDLDKTVFFPKGYSLSSEPVKAGGFSYVYTVIRTGSDAASFGGLKSAKNGDGDTLMIRRASLAQARKDRQYLVSIARELAASVGALRRGVDVSRIYAISRNRDLRTLPSSTAEYSKAADELFFIMHQYTTDLYKWFLLRCQVLKERKLECRTKEEKSRLWAEHEGDVCRVFAQILVRVKEMHADGLVHRDLKPSNVFIDYICKCQRPSESSRRPTCTGHCFNSRKPRVVLGDYGFVRCQSSNVAKNFEAGARQGSGSGMGMGGGGVDEEGFTAPGSGEKDAQLSNDLLVSSYVGTRMFNPPEYLLQSEFQNGFRCLPETVPWRVVDYKKVDMWYIGLALLQALCEDTNRLHCYNVPTEMLMFCVLYAKVMSDEDRAHWTPIVVALKLGTFSDKSIKEVQGSMEELREDANDLLKTVSSAGAEGGDALFVAKFGGEGALRTLLDVEIPAIIADAKVLFSAPAAGSAETASFDDYHTIANARYIALMAKINELYSRINEARNEVNDSYRAKKLMKRLEDTHKAVKAFGDKCNAELLAVCAKTREIAANNAYPPLLSLVDTRCSERAHALLQRLLVGDPSKRLSAAEALEDEWFLQSSQVKEAIASMEAEYAEHREEEQQAAPQQANLTAQEISQFTTMSEDSLWEYIMSVAPILPLDECEEYTAV